MKKTPKQLRHEALREMELNYGVDHKKYSKFDKKAMKGWLASNSKESVLLMGYYGKMEGASGFYLVWCSTSAKLKKTLASFLNHGCDDSLTFWDNEGKARLVKITGVKLL